MEDDPYLRRLSLAAGLLAAEYEAYSLDRKLKHYEGEKAGSTPKITNKQVWPPTEPPQGERIKVKPPELWVI